MKKNDKNNLTSELRHAFLIILPSVILGIRIAIVEKPKGIPLVVFLLVGVFVVFIFARELKRIFSKYKSKDRRLY